MPYTRQQQEQTGFRTISFLVCFTTRPQWNPFNVLTLTKVHSNQVYTNSLSS